MISVVEAKQAIIHATKPLHMVMIPIDEALGYTLAEDVFSKIDVPGFPQSSMDGYAFKFEPQEPQKALKIVGKVPAGRQQEFHINSGEAVRIFTGAPLPKEVDTVVMQEKTRVVGDFLYIDDPQIKHGENVRPKGSEIKKDALGLEKGTLLHPAGIGFLASVGITEVRVYAKPSVSIIVTGDELQEPGKPLEYGQVYESNSLTVKSVLKQLGIEKITVYKVVDDLEKLVSTLESALASSDMVLLTGGISVGEFDFVSRATLATGIEQVFHKIRQKPGKPIYFGMKGEKVVFGLPGNPASVLTCLYQYVTLALDQLSHTKTCLSKSSVPLEHDFYKKKGLTHFLKGVFNGNSVKIMDGQESYKLNSFAKSNCLVEIPEEMESVSAGTLVEIYRFI